MAQPEELAGWNSRTGGSIITPNCEPTGTE
jgi:hypothetical protein